MTPLSQNITVFTISILYKLAWSISCKLSYPRFVVPIWEERTAVNRHPSRHLAPVFDIGCLSIYWQVLNSNQYLQWLLSNCSRTKYSSLGMPDTSRVSFHFLTFFWTTLVQSDPKFMPQTQQILPRFYRHLSWDGLIASVPNLVPNINRIASKTCILDSVIRDLSTMDWSGTILSGKTFWTQVHYLFFAIPKSILIRFWQSIT